MMEDQIAQHYKAMLDSVWLINGIVSGELAGDDATVQRNVEHLELMLAKDFWTTEDMAPVQGAIASGNSFLGSV